MKYAVLSASALAMAATSGHAGGIDRSGQSIDAIFKPGTYAELSFGSATPKSRARNWQARRRAMANRAIWRRAI